MKSKVVFILPPYYTDLEKSRAPAWDICRIPPIGLFTIGSYLHQQGHEVRIIDCREIIVTYKTSEYLPILSQIVGEYKPDVIGINVLTALFDEATVICRELRQKFPNSLIIAGGVHPSVEPELTLKQNQYVDAICIGAGEEVCLDILDGQKITAIPGLMHRDHVTEFKTRAVNMDIDKYPIPDYALANSDFYTDFTLDTLNGWGYGGLAALTSRSCPYSCKFCASDWSKPFRYHSPEYVVEMARRFTRYDIDAIAFYDDTLAAIKDRLYQICRGFIRAKLFYPHTDMRWFAAVRANQVEPDILKLMKEAGCFGISMGIESGSDRMLKAINKKTTVDINKKACTYVKEAGLSLSISFMLGIPGETEADMNQTMAFMQETKCLSKGLGSFRPLPGSPFYNEFIQDDTLNKEDIDWTNLGNFTVMPANLFCDMPRDRFEQLFDKGTGIAGKDRWTAIHEDVFAKHSAVMKEIATNTRIKIARGDSYESSTHVAYTPFSLHTVSNWLLTTLRYLLPYPLRRRLRMLINYLRSGRVNTG